MTCPAWLLEVPKLPTLNKVFSAQPCNELLLCACCRPAWLAVCDVQTVGRNAASLMDPQFSRGPGSSSGSGSGGPMQGMPRTPSDWAATFDSCFELYGGSQAAEELEQLSSECAHICNR
jgi:hypothetical protein